MRLINYFKTAVRALVSQPVRSALTVVAMTISAAILLSIAAISLGIKQAVLDELNANGSLNTITVTSSQTLPGSGLFGSVQQVGQSSILSDQSLASLAKLAHVTAAIPVTTMWEFKSFTLPGSKSELKAQAQGLEPGDHSHVPLAAGSQFANADSRPVAIVGYAYAKAWGYAGRPQALIGHRLNITTQNGYVGAGSSPPGPGSTPAELTNFANRPTVLSATIVGITRPGLDENLLLIPLNWARQIQTRQYWDGDTLKLDDRLAANGYTSIIVKVDNKINAATVTQSIHNLGLGTTSSLDQVNSLLQLMLVVLTGLTAVGLIALIAAGLGTVNTMLMAVSEQRYEIGVRLVCGARRSQIAGLFLAEAGLLGLTGGLIGVGLGYLASQAANHQAAQALAAHNLPAITVIALPLWLIGSCVGLTWLLGVLAGVYPAFRATKVEPARLLDER